jgi:1,4-alpha-glucan branching enzyme
MSERDLLVEAAPNGELPGPSPSGAPPSRRRPAPAPDLEDVPASDVERFLSLTSHDPHAILGAHRTSRGVVVRAFRPDARRVTALPEGGAAQRMVRRHPAGLFEAFFPEAREIFPYRLRVETPDGDDVTIEDPYAFLPTVGEQDLWFFNEGRHERAQEFLGAHVREVRGVRGVSFAVWAPNARGVSVVGDFNRWDGRLHPMRLLGASGVWELFVPGLGPGALYKYEIRGADGRLFLKSDPYGFAMERPPQTASVVHVSRHVWGDQAWQERRAESDPWRSPVSIYEVHLGSWRRVPEEGRRPLTYREAAPLLADYVQEMGFTHVEFLPLQEHPYGPSWGYQTGGYYAPTARYGGPDDLKYLIDHLHRKGIGVLLDWVPAHFPKDAAALGRFDGTALYEHEDWRRGEHPDWGTYVFNYGRHEVRSFLISNALYWLSEYHVDGLRLDAVASMLYLDYSRAHGQWVPNVHGGRENLEAISFLRELNERAYARHPKALMVAEESTAWPGVSRPTSAGGLGFGFKWNMGWMHDTLFYFSRDPVFRKHHHHTLTFSLLYAWTENFILPLSHDEVVHGKRSLLHQMPGDRAAKFANLRALYGYLWAHPGKKLLFMGGEFAQENEWYHDASLDWHLLERAEHRGVQALVRDLNRAYRREPALWERDFEPEGFEWVDAWNADENVLAFLRIAPSRGRRLLCVSNFSAVPRAGYRVGLPGPGRYLEILNTDAAVYGGGNLGNCGAVVAEPVPWHGRSWSARLVLPPLATLWFEVPAP